jgi:hypothetical protein
MKPRYFLAAIICALLAAYPLSIGPVVRANLVKGDSPHTPMQAKFYAPILWLAINSSTFQNCLDWYFHLWIPLEYWPSAP